MGTFDSQLLKVSNQSFLTLAFCFYNHLAKAQGIFGKFLGFHMLDCF
jgi:hypothetical protein